MSGSRRESGTGLLVLHASTTRQPEFRRVGTVRVGPGHWTRTNKIRPTTDGVPRGRYRRWLPQYLCVERPLKEGIREKTEAPSGGTRFSS